jgi:hypothetical protein
MRRCIKARLCAMVDKRATVVKMDRFRTTGEVLEREPVFPAHRALMRESISRKSLVLW